jgi:hypothetical protein
MKLHKAEYVIYIAGMIVLACVGVLVFESLF